MKLVSTIVLCLSVLVNHAAVASESQWKSTHIVKINNENITITYSLQKNNLGYDATLIIQSSQNNTLWNHKYTMTKSDLEGDLLFFEDNMSVKAWIEHFFDGSLDYGATFAHFKIKNAEIDLDILDFYAQELHHTKYVLRKLIVSQPINTTFSYRASWREDLVMLVYIPELKKFIHYSNGGY